MLYRLYLRTKEGEMIYHYTNNILLYGESIKFTNYIFYTGNESNIINNMIENEKQINNIKDLRIEAIDEEEPLRFYKAAEDEKKKLDKYINRNKAIYKAYKLHEINYDEACKKLCTPIEE